MAALDGKKASDRSWKTVYVVLKTHAMLMYQDKRAATEHPLALEEPPVPLPESIVKIADDYTKRKNVFRLKTESGSEYLFQAESEADMREWVRAVEETATAIVVQVPTSQQQGGEQGPESGERKDGAARSLRKLTSFRNRSPSAHSPATKARKASQGTCHLLRTICMKFAFTRPIL